MSLIFYLIVFDVFIWVGPILSFWGQELKQRQTLAAMPTPQQSEKLPAVENVHADADAETVPAEIAEPDLSKNVSPIAVGVVAGFIFPKRDA